MRCYGSDKPIRKTHCPKASSAMIFVIGTLFCVAGSEITRADDLPSGSSGVPAIQPMTTISPNGSGYFSDPYPVRLTERGNAGLQVLSGTTKAFMSCTYPISAKCFSWIPGSVDVGVLRSVIAAAGVAVTNIQNLNAFQDDAGGWHAVVAIGVHSVAHPDHWTVLVHAHSTTAGTPLAWSADTVLSGSFSDPMGGNYDGKYFEDDGRLYLLYVKNFEPKPALRNGIVIQPMLSPTQLAPDAPTTLLMPGDRYGALDSERYGDSQIRLVEAPFIVRISGKYALIYSTGAYQQVDYKAAVAWSDTLIPPAGGRYRKVLERDTQGVWGRAGRYEVRYLLQSQIPSWPGFTGSQVISPGVASAVQGPGGAWWLYFAGFNPGDRPLVLPGIAKANHRRPFFVELRAAVPPGGAVATASDVELTTWLQCVLR